MPLEVISSFRIMVRISKTKGSISALIYYFFIFRNNQEVHKLFEGNHPPFLAFVKAVEQRSRNRVDELELRRRGVFFSSKQIEEVNISDIPETYINFTP